MSTIDYLIARGKTLTGRKLRDALHAATGNIVGGRGIRVSTINGQSVVSITGHTPRVAGRQATVFYAELVIDPLPDPLTDTVWDYPWIEVYPTVGISFQHLEDGRRWDDKNPPRRPARNLHEMRNADQFILGGVDLSLFPGGLNSRLYPATGNIEQINAPLQIVEMTELQASESDILLYWFTFANGVQPVCDEPLAEQLPPPPIRSLLA